jgi:hypothetical protein
VGGAGGASGCKDPRRAHVRAGGGPISCLRRRRSLWAVGSGGREWRAAIGCELAGELWGAGRERYFSFGEYGGFNNQKPDGIRQG